MRDHDLELIAALAEGRLEDESEARALIASSEEAKAEFEAQKLALSALSGASPVTMTENERSALHRDLWTELRGPAAGSVSSRTSPWYYRWMPVAAGMVVLFGLVAVLNQSGGDGMEAAQDQTAGLSASDTTSAMAEEFAGDDADADETRGETGAIAPTSTMAAADSGDGSTAEPPSSAAAAFYSAEADEIRSGEEPVYRSLGDFSTTEVEECLQQAGFDDYDVREVNATPDQNIENGEEVPEEAVPYVAATPFGDALDSAAVVFVALETCEVIHIDQ